MAASMDEVFAQARRRAADMAELEEIGFELLVSCRLRHQTGPPQLRGLPSAPTVIERTLWIPWVAQGSSWLFGEYFGGSLAGDGD